MREIERRASELDTYAELGQPCTFPTDIPFLGPLERSQELVRQALRQVERAEGRLLHSLFWFRANDKVDVTAIRALTSGQPTTARRHLTHALDANEGAPHSYSWRANRAVLLLWMAVNKHNFREAFDSALADFGFGVDETFASMASDVFGADMPRIDQEAVKARVVDELLAAARSEKSEPYGPFCLDVAKAFWSFPTSLRARLSNKISAPALEALERAIETSRANRQGNQSIESLQDVNGLKAMEPLLRALQNSLGVDDPHFQAAANAFAEEVNYCSVVAGDQETFNNPTVALRILEWASQLPTYGPITNTIQNNIRIVRGNIRYREQLALMKPFDELMQRDLHSVENADEFVTAMTPVLGQLRAAYVEDRDEFEELSSAAVRKVLNFLIDAVNDVQKPGASLGFDTIRQVISRAAHVTERLNIWQMSPETKAWFDNNLATVRGLRSKLEQVAQEQAPRAGTASPAGSSIPGWVYILGVIVMLAMCHSK